MSTRSLADEIRDELPSLKIDRDTRSAVEGWLSADKEFNLWFLVTTKRALADDELMEMLDGYRESQDTMTDAWSAFLDDLDGTKLEASIAISMAKMHALMKKG